MGLLEGPSLSEQPRLPGTVVGEWSMGRNRNGSKVTAATGRGDMKSPYFGNVSGQTLQESE